MSPGAPPRSRARDASGTPPTTTWNRETATYQVRLGAFATRDEALALSRTLSTRGFPGAFAVEESSAAKLAVPEEAIQAFRDWQVVFVRYGDWFEARPLELGRTDGGWVEVLSGLKPGERYAATNSYAIKAEIGKLGATHDH